MPFNVLVVRRGEKYTAKYPRMVRDQVLKHTTGDVKFTILGDGVDADRPLVNGWPGWWSKLELFAPWNMDLRPCLFLDLDTYVLGRIDDLVSHVPVRLTMLRDFNARERGQSAIMSIPQEVDHIWNIFNSAPEPMMKRHPGGDQAFLGQFPMDFLQDRFDGIYSYKVDRLQDDPRGRICCFHGKPKPHQTEGWAREVWDAA